MILRLAIPLGLPGWLGRFSWTVWDSLTHSHLRVALSVGQYWLSAGLMGRAGTLFLCQASYVLWWQWWQCFKIGNRGRASDASIFQITPVTFASVPLGCNLSQPIGSMGETPVKVHEHRCLKTIIATITTASYHSE